MHETVNAQHIRFTRNAEVFDVREHGIAQTLPLLLRVPAVKFRRIFCPASWADRDCFHCCVQIPFFVYWPLYFWREAEIRFLVWAVKNRDRVSL